MGKKWEKVYETCTVSVLDQPVHGSFFLSFDYPIFPDKIKDYYYFSTYIL